MIIRNGEFTVVRESRNFTLPFSKLRDWRVERVGVVVVIFCHYFDLSSFQSIGNKFIFHFISRFAFKVMKPDLETSIGFYIVIEKLYIICLKYGHYRIECWLFSQISFKPIDIFFNKNVTNIFIFQCFIT